MSDIIPIEFCDYSSAQLTGVLAHLITNIQKLANDLQESRPDVAETLDNFVDHPHERNIDFNVMDNFDGGVINGTRIMLDRKTNKFRFFNYPENMNRFDEFPAWDSTTAEAKIKNHMEKMRNFL